MKLGVDIHYPFDAGKMVGSHVTTLGACMEWMVPLFSYAKFSDVAVTTLSQAVILEC